jgi:hypothetical protein
VTKRTCTVSRCDRTHYGYGWCNKHYQRWRKWGDPTKTTLIFGDQEDRLIDKITVTTSGCWQWNSAGDDGYAMVRWAGKAQLAHRVVYETLVGPIPDSAELDHTCHSADTECPGGPCLHRSCVNPDHLEPVTPLVNSHRSLRNNRQSEKTHCPDNHPYSGANLYISPRGDRGCRVCRQAAARRCRDRRAGRKFAAKAGVS